MKTDTVDILPVFTKVIFTEILSNELPQIGWIILNNYHKWRQHPYLICTDEKKYMEYLSLDKEALQTDDDNESIIRGHEQLTIKYTDKLWKRISKQHEIFSNSKYLRDRIYFTSYFSNICRNKYSNIRVYLFRSFTFNLLSTLWNFISRVIISGTFFLIFGNLYQIYTGQYKKYKLQQSIIEIRKRDMPQHYSSYEGNDKSFEEKEIEEKEIELHKVTDNMVTASNALTATIIAIVGLIIAITK